MMAVILTNEEAAGLRSFLTGLIGKGSISTTPSWARRLIGKLDRDLRFSKPLVTVDAIGSGPVSIAGMKVEQIIVLKEFWMQHHEELPK